MMITHNLRLFSNLLVVAILLLVPVIAGFPWTRLDYSVAGAVLTGTVLLCELVLRKVTDKTHRIALISGILTMLLLFWAWCVA